jgi:hypothetical protein
LNSYDFSTKAFIVLKLLKNYYDSITGYTLKQIQDALIGKENRMIGKMKLKINIPMLLNMNNI